jgi:hypothetical protein
METSEYGELGLEEGDFVYGPASDHGADASEQEDAQSSCEEDFETPSEFISHAHSRAYALAQLRVRLHRLNDLFSVHDEAEDEDEEENDEDEETRQQHQLQKQERIASLLTPLTSPSEDKCSICHDTYDLEHQPVMLPCGHVFGKQCMSYWLTDTIEDTCPLDWWDHRPFLEDGESGETKASENSEDESDNSAEREIEKVLPRFWS